MTTNQLPPRKFTGGEYEEIRLLGEGGFARVYLVKDNLNQLWAIKLIKPEIKEARTRVERTLSSTIPDPWSTVNRNPRNPPNQSPWGKLLGLAGAIRLKKIAAIVATVVLLGLVAGILVWNLNNQDLWECDGLFF